MKRYDANKKALGKDKLARIPVKIEPSTPLRKPPWIRIRLSNNNKVDALKSILRENKLISVCEEASCPNLNECFNHGTASFMIMGDKCTRRCSFCDVGHGRPDPLDADEPAHLAQTILQLKLKYVEKVANRKLYDLLTEEPPIDSDKENSELCGGQLLEHNLSQCETY